MSAGDVLHMELIDESGAIGDIILVGDDTLAAPNPVIALPATNVTSSGFTANWTFTENADGYYFNLATDPDMTPHIGGYDNLDVGNVNHVVITGLTSGVTYYYQVSAYNDVGEGIESNIITTLITSALPLVDLDSNNYTTIVIGNQEWIVENLKVTKYADGSAIPNITADGSATAFTDWFLPSLNESNAMYTELTLHGVGLFTNNIYWSSSEVNASNGWFIDFSSGMQNGDNKSNTHYVRACRAFTSVTPSYSLRDIGPAGGLIFWKSGNDYIEAAPSDQSVSQSWSNITSVAVTGTGTAIGTGQANTTAIIGQVGHTDSAAKLCDDLSITYGGTGWLGDTSGAYCWYNNGIVNKPIYGALYNWYAVNNSKGLVYFERNGTHETGWRVPTNADWESLFAFLDGVNLAGGKLKESGTSHWISPNTGATDTFGFKGVPGGYRYNDGAFNYLGSFSYFWSCDEYTSLLAFLFNLNYNDTNIGEGEIWKAVGMSVRCVRDITVGTTYVIYDDPSDVSISFRKGVRYHSLVIDKTVVGSTLGFSGVEDVDWVNIKSVNFADDAI